MKLVFDVPRALGSVINSGVMFGIIVCIIVDSYIPKDVELLLYLPVSEPIVTYIPYLGSLLMDVVIHKACCSGIICLDWGWWLWMTKALQEVFDRNSHTGIVVHSSNLSFSSG